ncbi:unnamed protein product [Orchesella dallaii]|uniref:Odorant receptor n=1 Tax=Orchesella dallaii TaxID=48710 RepID=A0ABP1QVJ3_9HEXA
MQLSFCTPIRWDFEHDRLTPANQYSYWNFCCYLFYLASYGVILFVRFFYKNLINTNNETEDPDDEFTARLQKIAPAIMACDIVMSAIIIAICMGLSLTVQWKMEIINFFNSLLNLDAELQAKFKVQLNTHPLLKRTALVVDVLTFAIAISTLFIPILFAAFFLQEAEPLHRFLAEFLEVHVKPELKFIPHILFVMFSLLQCCNSAAFFLILGVMYNKFMIFWCTSLHPTSIKVIEPGRAAKAVLYQTQLGEIDGKTMILMYKTQQVLNVMFCQFVANRRAAILQFSIQVVVSVSGFVCIRYFWMMLLTPGFQLGFIAVGVGGLVMRVETGIVTEAIDASGILQKKIRNMTRRKAETVRCVVNNWTLKIPAAYPYYTISRSTFLQFLEKTVSIIVDLLVAY